MDDEQGNSEPAALPAVLDYCRAGIGPIVRILMRAGYSSSDAVNLLREAFVAEFYRTPEFWRNGQPSVLQCAVKTGLPRSIVDKIRKDGKPAAQNRRPKRNRAAHVLFAWLNDARYHNNGKADRLPITSPYGKSFRNLVRRYATGSRPGPILYDLQQAGCVQIVGDCVEIINHTYGLDGLEAKKLEISGFMLGRLGDTTEHNLITQEPENRRLKRIWWQGGIPKRKSRQAQKIIREIGEKAGREIDRALADLARHDEGSRTRVESGVCIFSYEKRH